MADNNKFFFRTETLNNDPDSYISVPEDLEWAVIDGAKRPIRRSSGDGRGSGDGNSGSMSPSGPGDDGEYFDPVPYPNTKIDTPVIRGIVKQEVSQDPEGKGTIDVTFSVEDMTQTDVEWEIRITR